MSVARFFPVMVVIVLLGSARAQCSEFWYVSTGDCPQVLGADPGPFLRASCLDSRGSMRRCKLERLWSEATERPVVFLVHGSYVTSDAALSEGLRIRADLDAAEVATAETIVVEFHWPSEFEDVHLVQDANEKARRAFVAGYHLARLLDRFPDDSRISLIGHSHGGLVVLAALQLLGGGSLVDGKDETILTEDGPALHLRSVIIASACDRHWLDPDERFGRALEACEAMLCLYNPIDPVLLVHPFGQYSERRRALGKFGMSPLERERLGSLGKRYRQRSIATVLGPRHTFRGTTSIAKIDSWMRPYAWATPK